MFGKNSAYKLILSPRAIKKLKELDINTRQRIKKATLGITSIPPQGDIKKIKGMKGTYRLRVGNWRVFFLFDRLNREVHVLDIALRQSAYK